MKGAGFHVWWWNGGAGDAFTELQIDCGSFGRTQLANYCSLDPPLLGKPFRKVVQAETMRTICETIVRAWQPDYGFVSSYQFREQNSLLPARGPEPGWIVYLADHYFSQLPKLPTFAKLTAIPRHGHLISATESRFTASNPRHVEAAMRIGEVLGFFANKPRSIPSMSKPVPLKTEPMQLSLKYNPTLRNAPKFAADIAAAALDISGVKLDYSPKSLRLVDEILEGMRSEGVKPEQVAETLFGFGCYVGEVFVRNSGGKWRKQEDKELQDFGAFPLVIESVGKHGV